MRQAIKPKTAIIATADDRRWQRILARDKAADGSFWYSVDTTGIYCRPSCPSRHANPKNVQLHETLADAKATGFRACKRCNPCGLSTDATNIEIVANACRLIEQRVTMPTLTELAEATGLSPGYFHRLFKAATGLTPKAYGDGQRANRVRAELATSGSVTQAFYEAGFGSSGRFYEQADAILGMKPARYKAGGTDEEIRFAIAQSSLGAILIAASVKGLVSILMGDDPTRLAEDLQDRFPKAKFVGGDEDFDTLVARVIALVDAPVLGTDLPLDVRGTAFQQRVWQALRDIPAGSTASYRDIAERIGAPRAVRAVAGACAANNIAIAIPCHRVVRTDGALSGYAWGVERKRELLQREGLPSAGTTTPSQA